MTDTEINDLFENLSLDDVDRIVKRGQEIKRATREQRKAQKEREKQELHDRGVRLASEASEGDQVEITLKGERKVVSFLKMTDKRFTVETDDGKRSIMFDKLHRNLTADEGLREEEENVDEVV